VFNHVALSVELPLPPITPWRRLAVSETLASHLRKQSWSRRTDLRQDGPMTFLMRTQPVSAVRVLRLVIVCSIFVPFKMYWSRFR
jgi:hypothetical protein